MKQMIILFDDASGVEDFCGLAIKASMEAMLNRSRRVSTSYAVHEDVQQWFDSGKPSEIVFFKQHSELEMIYKKSSSMMLCGAALRDSEGLMVGIGLGPYQDGVLNTVLGDFRKINEVA